MGLTLLLMAGVVAWIASSAYRGKGYRGIYLAIAMTSLVGTVGCFSIVPTSRDLRTATDASQREGLKAMATIGPSLGGLWMAATFGALLGAALYRTPRVQAAATQQPLVVSPAPPPQAPIAAAPDSGTRRKISVALPGTGEGFFVEVVGESNYQPQLKRLKAQAGNDTVRVLLHPEPENPHDAGAVAVKTFDGETVGYLPRDNAPRYQQTLLALRERGQTGICSARLVGGDNDKPNLGIWLDLDAPTAVAASLDVKYKPVRRQPTATL